METVETAMNSSGDFLTKSIHNVQKILTFLVMEKIIFASEYNQIEQKFDKSKKYGILKLLDVIITKKSADRIRFLEILQITDNQKGSEFIESYLNSNSKLDDYHVEDMADELSLNYDEMDDFEVPRDSIHKIADLLSKYPNLRSNWGIVVEVLDLTRFSRHSVFRHIRYDIYETLVLWLERNRARFSHLVRAVGEYAGHILAAETLLKNQSHTSHLSHHLSYQSLESKTLRRLVKWWQFGNVLPIPFCERMSDEISLIHKIHKHLSEISLRSAQTVLLTGPPGVGKSIAAIWFSKEYESMFDHIFLIDCRSMEKQIHIIANGMGNKCSFNKSALSDITRLCFEELQAFSCLWVYDNIENYDGPEEFEDLLPVKYTNVKMIVVSRNRIWKSRFTHQQFTIHGFGEIEAVEFIKENVKHLGDGKQELISHLCQLLGCLPFTLQIAITALNTNQANLMELMDRVRTTDVIIHETFFHYRQPFYEFVRSHYFNFLNNYRILESDRDSGCSILSIVAYITPYNIPIRLFESIENKSEIEIQKSIRILSDYNFVTVSAKNNSVSINPVVQQVIRHMKKNNKNEILKKIMNCDGFIDFKLIPFCFANRNMRNDYAKVHADLIKDIELENLFMEKRFAEAAKLSGLQYDANPTILSTYNHAFCLLHNFEICEAKIYFQSLYNLEFCIENDIFNYPKLLSVKDEKHDLEILKSSKNIYRELIAGHLLLIYIYEDNTDEVARLLKTSAIIFKYTTSMALEVLPSFTSNYRCLLKLNGNTNIACLILSDEYGCSEFSNCYLDERMIATNLHELNLESVVTSSNLFAYISATQIKILTLTKMRVDLSGALSFDEVRLKCVQIQNWKTSQWKIRILTLEDVPFIEETLMEITKLNVVNSEVCIEVLSDSITKLHITRSKVHTVVRCSPLAVRLQSCLEDCTFISSIFVDKDGIHLPNFDISTSLKKYAKKLQKLTLDCSAANSTHLSVHLDCLTSLSTIQLQECTLTLTHDVFIGPQILSLKRIKFLEDNQQEKSDVIVNTFVIFDKMTSLELENISVNLSGNISMNAVGLDGVKIIDWNNARWKIKKLSLINIPFVEENKLKIEELFFKGSIIDISCLQKKTMRNLTIKSSRHCSKSTNAGKFSLDALTIDDVTFEIKNCKEITQENQKYLNSLLKMSSIRKLTMNKIRSPIALDCLTDISTLFLRQCIIVAKGEVRINPKELTLIDVKIILKKKFYSQTTNLVNHVVRFCKLQKMCLVGMRVDTLEKGFSNIELKYYETEFDHQNQYSGESFQCTDGDMNHSVSIISVGLNKTELNKCEQIKIEYPSNDNQKLNVDESTIPIIPNDEQSNDFLVSERGALQIKNILKNYTELEEEWKTEVPLLLDLSGKSKGELQKCRSGFGTVIILTLNLWRIEKGENALFNEFLQVFKENGLLHKLALEDLLKNREQIRFAGRRY